jgi:hypothetical protein
LTAHSMQVTRPSTGVLVHCQRTQTRTWSFLGGCWDDATRIVDNTMVNVIHLDIARVLAVVDANGALHNSILYTTI